MKQQLLAIKLFLEHLISGLIKRLNGSHVHAFVVKTDNGLFAVDPEDFGVGRQLRTKGHYGQDEIHRLTTRIQQNSRVLFVGAHIGTLAIPIAKRCKEVVAIEANPKTFELLSQNIALNAASNCQAINIAASNQAENIKFLLNRTNSGGSKRVPLHRKYIYYYDNPEEMTIQAVSLDRYLDNTVFDMVVMDIEGSEFFALQGMQTILAQTQSLVIEFLPHHLKNVSGVTIREFLSVIAPYFSKLTIPSQQKTVTSAEFFSCLSDMYDKGQGDDGIIFEKN